MSSSRLELKVGLFMVVCLALAAALAIRFSETRMGLAETYTVVMETQSAGNLVDHANVVMSGVRIGYVNKVELQDDGNVWIFLRIFDRYRVHENDEFAVASVGLMGDQYVSVSPTNNRGSKLEMDGHVVARESMSLERIGEKAEGLVERVDGMVMKLDGLVGTFSNMVHRVDQDLLSGNTLSNLNATIANVHDVSGEVKMFSERMVLVTEQMTNIAQRGISVVERVEGTVGQIQSLVATNAPNVAALFADLRRTTESMDKTVGQLEKVVADAQPQLAKVMENAAKASDSVQRAATSVEQTVATNRVVVGQSIKNVRQLTARLDKTAEQIEKSVVENSESIRGIVTNAREVSVNLKEATGNISRVIALFEKGEGLAGGLFQDEKMKADFAQMVTNFSHTSLRMSTLVSNLNEYGILWKGERSERSPPRIFRPKSRLEK
ncbi:MAG: hypothetical protein CMO66_00640 [Verrucomicrobiales bacterium]|nr:hypothetical protein [Verrucomicrobiales bacterium]